MKFTVLQENLHKGLAIVSRAVASRAQLPILTHILLEADKNTLFLSATNLEISIKLQVSAEIETPGKITIPAKTFLEFVNSLPKDTIQVSLKENLLTADCKQFKAKFNTLSAEEFPKLASLSETALSFSLAAEQFEKAITQTAFAAAADEGRPVLTGIIFKFSPKNLHLAATDGYRLSLKKLPLPSLKEIPKDLVIPARALLESARIVKELKTEKEKKEEVQIFLFKNQLIFSFNNAQIATRLIDGEYPDYEKIIPSEKDTSCEIDTKEFTQSVRLASIFARDSANIVKLTIKDDNLTISADSPQIGQNQTDLNIKKQGKNNQIAFNSRYLLELLANIESETIIFEMKSSLSPGVFKIAADSSFLHIIMPVRLQTEEEK